MKLYYDGMKTYPLGSYLSPNMNSGTIEYKTPPIEEAIVEFRFKYNTEWDITYPGIIHEKVKDFYLGKPQSFVPSVDLRIQVQGQPLQSSFSSSNTVDPNMLIARFSNQNGTRKLTVGPDVLAIHFLRPYSNWAEFLDKINKALEAYCSVAKPMEVLRVSQRFINKITIHEKDIDLSKYFKIFPVAPQKFILPLNNFFYNISSTANTDGISCVLIFTTAESPEGSVSLFLDIDTKCEKTNPSMTIEESLISLGKLRILRNEIFESSIQDELRRTFDDT
jgi:uncharacterized protein (TIGR04255 family)